MLPTERKEYLRILLCWCHHQTWQAKEMSRDTTDMPNVTEKEKETLNNTWGLLEEVVRLLHVSLITVCGFDYNRNTWDDSVTSEIMHNILANYDVPHTRNHAPRAGHDIYISYCLT